MYTGIYIYSSKAGKFAVATLSFMHLGNHQATENAVCICIMCGNLHHFEPKVLYKSIQNWQISQGRILQHFVTNFAVFALSSCSDGFCFHV